MDAISNIFASYPDAWIIRGNGWGSQRGIAGRNKLVVVNGPMSRPRVVAVVEYTREMMMEHAKKIIGSGGTIGEMLDRLKVA